MRVEQSSNSEIQDITGPVGLLHANTIYWPLPRYLIINAEPQKIQEDDMSLVQAQLSVMREVFFVMGVLLAPVVRW